MHWEIINRQFNVFFVEKQLKKDNLKCAFWVFFSPKQPGYVTAGRKNSQSISLRVLFSCVFHEMFIEVL